MATTYKKMLSIMFLLLVIIVASLYSSITIEGYASDTLKEQIVQFFPQKYYNGVPFEMELYKKKYVIPEEFRGKVQSVSIPDMYALYVYSNDSFSGTYAKLMGNVPDIDAVLQNTPGWTGSIVGVKVIGEYIRVYEKPEFKGRNVRLLSKQGYALFKIGPQDAQQVSSYKREDAMSFRVPKGLIVVVTTITEDGTREQKQYSGGDYPTTVIPDTLGTKLFILREPLP
jgi:hypothetical protein